MSLKIGGVWYTLFACSDTNDVIDLLPWQLRVNTNVTVASAWLYPAY